MTCLARSLLIGLLLPAAAQAQAYVTFSGTVVDSARRPLGNAEVSIASMNVTRTTDEKGVFRFQAVTAGVHRVSVRKIGYALLDTTLAFKEAEDVEWRVTMRERVVTLDSVIVSAPVDPLMKEFEENMKRGFGRFITRAELEKKGGTSFPAIMQTVSGASVIRTNGGLSYITSKRAPATGCHPPRPRGESPAAAAEAQEAEDRCLRRERLYYVPDPTELRLGVRRACYPLVYVDRTLMNSGRPTVPFDVAPYTADQLEAIEWFESTSQTPPKYANFQAQCGVLVLHLRKKK